MGSLKKNPFLKVSMLFGFGNPTLLVTQMFLHHLEKKVQPQLGKLTHTVEVTKLPHVGIGIVFQ